MKREIGVVATRPGAKVPWTNNTIVAKLFAPENFIVRGSHLAEVNLGVLIDFPKESVGLVFSCTPLMAKGVGVVIDVLESANIGNARLLLKNNTRNDIEITAGEHIANLVVVPAIAGDFILQGRRY